MTLSDMVTAYSVIQNFHASGYDLVMVRYMVWDSLGTYISVFTGGMCIAERYTADCVKEKLRFPANINFGKVTYPVLSVKQISKILFNTEVPQT